VSNLSPLAGVISIGGRLNIGPTSVLSTLEGLISLGRIGGDLDISDNEALPQCEVDKLIARIGTANIHGTITTINNAGTCTAP
jgi:hypothetical protein